MVGFPALFAITSAVTLVLRAVGDVTCQVIEIRSTIRIAQKHKECQKLIPRKDSDAGSGEDDETGDLGPKEFSWSRVFTQVMIELVYINPAMLLSLKIANMGFPGLNTIGNALGRSVIMGVVCPFTIGLNYLIVNEYVRTRDFRSVVKKVRNEGLEMMSVQATFWFLVDIVNFMLLPEMWQNRTFGLTVGVFYITFSSYIAHRDESEQLASVELVRRFRLALETQSSKTTEQPEVVVKKQDAGAYER